MKFYSGISLITLGVENVENSSRFYESLGWRRSIGASHPAITFFALNTLAIALFPRDALAQDCGLDGEALAPSCAFSSVTLAQNHGSRPAVDAVMQQARAAGAKILKSATATDWGGYHGIFSDPDGHIWEICHNPLFPLAVDGSVSLPP